MAVSADRTRKQKITIDANEIDATLTDFPTYLDRVHFNAEVLSPTDGNRSQSDGGDVEISSDEDGVTRLELEIVAWEYDTSDAAADATLEAHTLLPSISASVNTDFWAWYNTPTTSAQPAASATYGSEAVWVNYVFVYHFNESPTGTIIDSAGNHDATSVGSMTSGDLVGGAFGAGALDFDGSNDGVNTGYTPGSGISPYSVSCWVNYDAQSGTDFLIDCSNGSTGFGLYATNSLGYKWKFQHYSPTTGEASAQGGTPTTSAGWQHVAGTQDPTADLQIYENGILLATDAGEGGDMTAATNPVMIGIEYDQTSETDGQIDEARFCESRLTAAQLAAEVSNHSTPGTFASAGTPEAVGGGGGGVGPWWWREQVQRKRAG